MNEAEDVNFSVDGESFSPETGELVTAVVAPSALATRTPQPLALGQAAAFARAARAQAIVRGRMELARELPRSYAKVRQDLLDECNNPGFADAALYAKPIGGGNKAEGFSIRFAESCARIMGHLDTTSEIIEEDGASQLLEVTTMDFQTGSSWTDNVRLSKTVERSFVREGQRVVAERQNSQGKKTFIVIASEDEMNTKKASAVSKMSRNLILRLVPAEIKDECKARCERVLATKDAKDPKVTLREIADRFGEVGVAADQIELFLGHPLDRVAPAEVAELRKALGALREGESSWSTILEARLASKKRGTAPAPSAPSPESAAPKSAAPAVQTTPAAAPAPAKVPEPAKETPAPTPSTPPPSEVKPPVSAPPTEAPKSPAPPELEAIFAELTRLQNDPTAQLDAIKAISKRARALSKIDQEKVRPLYNATEMNLKARVKPPEREPGSDG